MGHYKSNVRDLEFNLFEVLGINESLDAGEFGDLDTDTAKAILHEIANLAEGPIAESFASADRNPPVFDPETHTASIPEDFKKSQAAYMDSGFWSMCLPEELGGTPAPSALGWARGELILGANPAVFMFAAGPSFSAIAYKNSTDDEQRRRAEIAMERGWGATMVLTEPDAGSDVGAGRTKAIKQEDGSWHIEGVKRFITSADADDMFENTIHLVLARPEGAGPGTKGLSLFFVPKFHFDLESGELGERNGAFVTNIEHKMGLKVSTTCELTFGGHGVPAKGWLIGDDLNLGIRQMFDVIENARMMVGTKAIATLSTGYLNALDYAKERVQGGDLTQMTDKTAPRVTITHHPDVRRALMRQKAFAEGLRSVYMYTAAHQDPEIAARVSGADEGLAFRVNDLLLPIVKGVGSERAYEVLTESLQTFGGSGFLQDYPIEQYIRDAKIDSLYEGTTAIQAQDFFFRKIARDQGKALGHLSSKMKEFIADDKVSGKLDAERKTLGEAIEAYEAIIGKAIEYAMGAADEPTNLYKIGLVSVRVLMSFGDIMMAWRLLVGAEVAINALESASGDDKAFYTGKIEAAKWFTRNELPAIFQVKDLVEDVDLGIMEMDEAAF